MDRESVAIYPEGRHGGHRQLLPFQPGVSILAALADVPVVMVYIDGPHSLLHRSRLIIAPPIRLETPKSGIDTDYIDRQTRMLESEMDKLMKEFISTEGSRGQFP